MRIMVMGLRGFPGVQGGVERHAEQLYPLLVGHGCDIEVVVRSPYHRREQMLHWQGIRFHRLWAPTVGGLEALVHSLLATLYAAVKRPDVLHIHAVGPALMTPLARLLGLRVVVTHHGPDYDREKWGRFARWVLRMGERWGMRYAHGCIAISGVVRQLVASRYRRDAVTIPNGVRLPEPPQTDGILRRFGLAPGCYVLQVSRLVPEKRQLDLIRAFAAAELGDWKLALVGAVDEGDGYHQQVIALAQQMPRVILTGFQSGCALEELYGHAGLFVLPSSHEGLPIALLEALSYGLPVLASDIPANLEIGLGREHHFRLGDTTDLAQRIRAHAGRPVDHAARRQTRAWVAERYDWDVIARQTLEVYRGVAALPTVADARRP